MNNITDIPIRCSSCKCFIPYETIYKTDEKLGIIGECCSELWGDVQPIDDMENK